MGQSIYGIAGGGLDLAPLRKHMEQVLPADLSFEDLHVQYTTKSGDVRKLVLNGRRLEQAQTLPAKILLAMDDNGTTTEK